MPHSNNPARRVPFAFYEQDQVDQLMTGIEQTLPSNHFLAQRPVTPPPPPSDIASSPPLSHPPVSWIDSARPDTSTLAAADFDVSVETGFLPPQPPLESLADLDYGWREMEECLSAAKAEVDTIEGGGVGKMSEAFRSRVRNLPTVDTSILTTLPLLRRAHTLLAHLTHFYMHSSFPSQTVVPASLSIPLVQVSEKLGMPPILTYADTVLWVWKLNDSTKPLRQDNVEITTTFTSSPSEQAFFLLSLFCELYGPSILRLMSSTLDETFFSDRVALVRIAFYLTSISHLIDELRNLMHDAVKGGFGPLVDDGTGTGNHKKRETIVPSVFYWEIRPWFNGGKWLYERVGPDGEDVEMEFGGPSAGQSSLVHAIDLFLGIDHAPRSDDKAGEHGMDKGKGRDKLEDSTFMQRMSAYMPHHHRSFLQHLASIHSITQSSSLPSLRSLALENPSLQPSYDQAVSSMKRFRDTHIILATHFIVSQARHAPEPGSVYFAEWETKRLVKEKEHELRRKAIEEGNVGMAIKKEVIAGTGGTDLSSFLKLCRDRTKEALLEG